MDTLEQSDNMIKHHLKNIDFAIKDLKKDTVYSSRKNKIRNLKSEIESIRSQLDIFEIDLCSATEKQRNIYFNNKEEYTSQVNDIETELRNLETADLGKVGGNGANGELIDERTRLRNQPKSFEQMERQELVTNINNQIDEADEDLNLIIGDLMKGKNIMQEINEEVKRQQEKLSKAGEDIKEVYSLTKRSKKLVSYFKRQIMTDKLLCSFVILIIIAIIVIIILKAVGFKSDKFNSDILPNASINMNNSTATKTA
jgi:hypothetical protein